MSDQLVRLRPAGADDLPQIEKRLSASSAAGDYQWFGPRASSALRRRFDEDGLLGPDGGEPIVVAGDNAFAGQVNWFKSFWGPPEHSWCWTVGITIDERWRGRGIGTAAQRLIVEHLFAHTRVHRIQAYTDINNVAEQHVLEKVGFTREGVIRSAQWREGCWHDQILYSILRPNS
ncbi:MAG: GNAT family protein [Candidatus Tumulicola sp.]